MYMVRHGGRAGRAATLLGRLKYCSPMFSDRASSIFRARLSRARSFFFRLYNALLNETVKLVYENRERFSDCRGASRPNIFLVRKSDG
ncbi:hypothetical protein PUN28_004833 [Cardiocondyla obscurior]|uniref:Ribosomal protein L20 n=1 Tax=Cardiocondyla obscurior TaxID=286306 RepID=A0AAW2GIT3_9HYME